MQAVAERSSALPKILVFRTRMAAPDTTPPQPPNPQQGFHPPTHGNWAQWAAVFIASLAFLGLLANIGLTLYFHYTASQSQASDDHVNGLIRGQVDSAKKDINDHIDKKVDPLSDKIDRLSDRVSRIEGRLDKRVSSLERRADQQTSLAKLLDPSRILAMIRRDIQTAQDSNKLLTISDVNDYRNAVQALPTTAYEYWTTAAAIINYQSYINQMSGEAPDPATVSRPCGGLTAGTGGNNAYFGPFVFERCIVDLDATHNLISGAIFRNSVIRYHGGPTYLSNIQFLNCRFQLELPASVPANPERNRLLMALLNAPDTKTVTVSTTKPPA